MYTLKDCKTDIFFHLKCNLNNNKKNPKCNKKCNPKSNFLTKEYALLTSSGSCLGDALIEPLDVSVCIKKENNNF